MVACLPVAADVIDEDEPVRMETDQCTEFPLETAIDSELASVGFMKNIAEHPESIRVIATELLNKAVAAPVFKTTPACQDKCSGALEARVVYSVEPTVFLPESEQQAMCLTLEEETTASPLQFPDQSFDSIEKLNKWIMEFSQGRGDAGKDLYKRCGGNCSPRYRFHISKMDEELTLSTEVLCGFARDKKSDQYLISTAVLWRCANP